MTRETSSCPLRYFATAARVRDVPLHPQRQRLEPLEEEERVERAHARAEVAQRLRADLHQIAVHAERLVELKAVVRGGRIGDDREAAVRPVERARVDDHTADARAVAADELRRRVQHDVRAPVDRPAQVRRRERVVDEQRRAVLVRETRERLDVEHVAARVADRLAEKRLRVRPDRRFPRVEVVRIDPRELHRHLVQQVLELIHRAAVERRRRHDVIAGRQHREERAGLRRDAARERHRSAAALEARHPLLERGHGRIHDPRIGVAVFLEIEVRGRGLRVLEHVARGLVNRHRARAGARIGALARVDLAGGETELSRLFHRSLLSARGTGES